MNARNIVVAVAAALAIGGIAACGSVAQPISGTTHTSAPPAVTQPPADTATTPPDVTQSLAVGKPLFITKDGQNAGSVTIVSVRNTTQPADMYGMAPQNGYFIIAPVIVASTVNGLMVSTFDFYAVVNGQHYSSFNGNSSSALSNYPDTMSGQLNVGETAQSTLLFDLPSTHGQIVFAPNFQGAPLASWSF